MKSLFGEAEKEEAAPTSSSVSSPIWTPSTNAATTASIPTPASSSPTASTTRCGASCGRCGPTRSSSPRPPPRSSRARVHKIVHNPPLTSIEKASHEDVATQEEMLFKWMTDCEAGASAAVRVRRRVQVPGRAVQGRPIHLRRGVVLPLLQARRRGPRALLQGRGSRRRGPAAPRRRQRRGRHRAGPLCEGHPGDG